MLPRKDQRLHHAPPASQRSVGSFIRITVRNNVNNTVVESVCFETSATVRDLVALVDPHLLLQGAVFVSIDDDEQRTLTQCGHRTLRQLGVGEGAVVAVSGVSAGAAAVLPSPATTTSGGGSPGGSPCPLPNTITPLPRLQLAQALPPLERPDAAAASASARLRVTVRDDTAGEGAVPRSMVFDGGCTLRAFLGKASPATWRRLFPLPASAATEAACERGNGKGDAASVGGGAQAEDGTPGRTATDKERLQEPMDTTRSITSSRLSQTQRQIYAHSSVARIELMRDGCDGSEESCGGGEDVGGDDDGTASAFVLQVSADFSTESSARAVAVLLDDAARTLREIGVRTGDCLSVRRRSSSSEGDGGGGESERQSGQSGCRLAAADDDLVSLGKAGSAGGGDERYDRNMLLADATNTSRDSHSQASDLQSAATTLHTTATKPDSPEPPPGPSRPPPKAVHITPPLEEVVTWDEYQRLTSAAPDDHAPFYVVRQVNDFHLTGEWEGEGPPDSGESLCIKGDARVAGVLEVEMKSGEGGVVEDLLLCGKVVWYCLRVQEAGNDDTTDDDDSSWSLNDQAFASEPQQQQRERRKTRRGESVPAAKYFIDSNVLTYIPSMHDLGCCVQAVFTTDRGDSTYSAATPPIQDVPVVKNAYFKGVPTVGSALTVLYEVIGGASRSQVDWDVLRPLSATGGGGSVPRGVHSSFIVVDSYDDHGSTLRLTNEHAGCLVRCRVTPALLKNGCVRGDGCAVITILPVKSNRPVIKGLELKYGEALVEGAAVEAVAQVEGHQPGLQSYASSYSNDAFLRSRNTTLVGSGKYLLLREDESVDDATSTDGTGSTPRGALCDGGAAGAAGGGGEARGIAGGGSGGDEDDCDSARCTVSVVITWSVDNKVLEGETGIRYVIKADDLGKRLDCTYQLKVTEGAAGSEEFFSDVATAALDIPGVEQARPRMLPSSVIAPSQTLTLSSAEAAACAVFSKTHAPTQRTQRAIEGAAAVRFYNHAASKDAAAVEEAAWTPSKTGTYASVFRRDATPSVSDIGSFIQGRDASGGTCCAYVSVGRGDAASIASDIGGQGVKGFNVYRAVPSSAAPEPPDAPAAAPAKYHMILTTKYVKLMASEDKRVAVKKRWGNDMRLELDEAATSVDDRRFAVTFHVDKTTSFGMFVTRPEERNLLVISFRVCLSAIPPSLVYPQHSTVLPRRGSACPVFGRLRRSSQSQRRIACVEQVGGEAQRVPRVHLHGMQPVISAE